MEVPTMTIDLEPFYKLGAFCSFGLRPPFVLSGHRYATDGRIMVRVPTDDADAPIDPVSWLVSVQSIIADINQRDCSVPWPYKPGDIVPDRKPCDYCGGSGKAPKICGECNGYGEVICQTCGEGYVDCKACQGTGRFGESAERCEDCDGTGKEEAWPAVPIGCLHIGGYYAMAVAGLPNPRYAEPSPKDDRIWFTFDGGEGVLMCVKA